MTSPEAKSWVEDHDFEYFKYIRLMDDTFEFSVVGLYSAEHAGMANGRPVKSAGYCGVNTKSVYLEGHSTTLGIGRLADDGVLMSQIFNVSVREED